MPKNPDNPTMKSRDFHVPPVEPVASQSLETDKAITCTEVRAADGRILFKYETPGEPAIVLPKRLEEMTEQEFYDLPITLYDNTPGRLPGNLIVEFKDPQWAGHWFNKSAGNGARVSVGLTLGYLPAKKEDLRYYFKGLNDKDGAVEMHDLILMKIPRHKLYLQYKQWMDVAKKRGGVGAFSQQAYRELTPARQEKVDYFLTPQSEQEHQGLGPVVHYQTIPHEKQSNRPRR